MQFRVAVSPVGVHPSVALVHSTLPCQTADTSRSSFAPLFVVPDGCCGFGGGLVAWTVRSVSVSCTLFALGVPLMAITPSLGLVLDPPGKAVSALLTVTQQVVVGDSDWTGTGRNSLVDVKSTKFT